MGISTEILNIKNKISDTFASLSNKSVSIPDNSNSDNLARLIESIPYYSCPNGTQWTQSNITEGDWHIVYGNGIYVACSTDISRGVLYSFDGITWYTSNVAFRIYHTEALKYANGIWILGGIYYSTDGINWMINNIKNQYITNVEYANGIWFCGSVINNNVALFYSTDGMRWNSTGIGGYLYFLKRINNIWFACLNNVLYYSVDGITWIRCLTLNTSSGRIFQIIYAKGIYLTYDGFTGLSYYSNNGINWKTDNIICISMKALEYANGLFVASTENGLQYSTNGLDWNQSNITEITNNEVYYINDVWFAYGYYNNAFINFYSIDGMNWFSSKYNLIRFITNKHGLWIISNQSVIQYSTDYTDWTTVNIALRNVLCNELVCEDNIWLASYAEPYNYNYNFYTRSNMGIWYSKVWEQPNIEEIK